MPSRLFRIFFIFSFFIVPLCKVHAQTFDSLALKPKRLIVLTGLLSTGYVSSLLVLNEFWYKPFPKSKFYFFNDNAEWNQMDKFGHAFSGYLLSRLSYEGFNWTGLKDEKAIVYGSLVSFLYLSNIEVLDGVSAKWGASAGDVLGNTFGAALFVTQQFAWDEQKVLLKVSTHRKKYSGDLKNRAQQLFGDNFLERSLKDYNAQTYWLSFNMASLFNTPKDFPQWLNVALGYGSEGLLGVFENKWNNDGVLLDRTDIKRYRQYYVTLDIDWAKIPTHKKGLKVLFKIFRLIKLPFPTVEMNSVNGAKFHWLYF